VKGREGNEGWLKPRHSATPFLQRMLVLESMCRENKILQPDVL
jgi:hypothetical protein